MKGNRELDELLISYLLKELDAEDEAFVKEQICINNDARNQFLELQNTLRLLDIKKELEKVDIENEWDRFGKAVAGEKQKLVSIKKPQAMEESNILEEEKTGKRYNARRILLSIAIPASVMTLIVLAWNYSASNETPSAQNSKAVAQEPIPAPSILRHETNTSGKTRKLLLTDGSEILLYDKSEVSYEEPFTGNRRDITLKGKAKFTVSKDKTRPFTVHSLALTTTALGTRFTVSAFENAENISVKLYEGKVVVKSAEHVKIKLVQDYFLRPGEELIYNNNNYTAQVLNIREKSPARQDNNTGEVFNDNPGLQHKGGEWYMFNNQPLEQVFDQLQVLYHTEIQYSKKQVHNIYFIGEFDKNDSLFSVLSQIASPNNLKIIRKNKKFIITK